MKRKVRMGLYALKYAFNGLRHHFVLSISAVSAITITLLMVALCAVIGFNINHFSDNITGDLMIHVVLNPSRDTPQEIEQIQKDLEAVPNVKSVSYSDKDQELELMIEEKGEAYARYRGENNPLANAFFVTLKDNTQIEETASLLRKVYGVDSVAYGGQSVHELVDVLELARRSGYILAILLLILSVYLIYNTIRTTIYSQQDEIGVMTMVGASYRFIKIPFVAQGMIIGMLGAFIPTLTVWIGYARMYERLNGIFFANILSLIDVGTMRLKAGMGIMVLGMVIGFTASLMAVTKYLRINR